MDENREEKQKIWVSKAWLRRDKNSRPYQWHKNKNEKNNIGFTPVSRLL